eukprot:4561068-Alexandrium_andersonii.AAC.1
MSASLVGSEMCIRDRNSSVVRSKLQVARRRRAHNEHNSAMWRSGVPTRAVSYTHLTLPTICSV